MTSRIECSDGDTVIDHIDTKMGESVSSVTSITSVDDAQAKCTTNRYCSTLSSLTSIPNQNDVLSMKGAAVQLTKQPGTLYSNQLCEEALSIRSSLSNNDKSDCK